MSKYAISIIETVIHDHRLIIDCDNKETAENIADKLFEKAKEGSFSHNSDVVVEAEKMAAVIELDEDYSVYIENITIGEDEAYEIKL